MTVLLKYFLKVYTKVSIAEDDGKSINKFKFEFVKFEDPEKKVGQKVYLIGFTIIL